MGGLAHRGTYMAYLNLHLFQATCSKLNITSIILFSDFTQALYSVILQFVTSMKGQPQDLDVILEDLAIPEFLAPFLREVVAAPKLLDDFTDAHVRAPVAETFRIPVVRSQKCLSPGPEQTWDKAGNAFGRCHF